MSTGRNTARDLVRILFLLAVVALILAGASAPADGGGNGNDNGAVPLLVKSRVPLTPDVVAAISSHAAQVSFVWPEINALALKAVPSKMAELVADPLVELVEPDLQAQAISDDTQLPTDLASPPSVTVPIFSSSGPIRTWNLDMADTEGSGKDGSGVTVAVVDSGLPQNWAEFLPPDCVDLDHAAGFGPEGVGSYHNPVNAIRGAGGHIGLFPHGLAVSSVIVGFPSDFGPVGGSAPGAKILPIRVLNQFNFGYFSWFTAGILHVGRLKADGLITGPLVINFSIQGGGSSQILTDAINYAIANHVLFVTIAGNFGPAPGSLSFPGRLPQSITVGAVGWKGEGSVPGWFFADVPENNASQIYVAGFSGRQPSSAPPASLIDVLAPGSYVYGEWLGGPGFSEGREVAFDAVSNFIFGTSFAAPHVTGIVAQMLEKKPGMTQLEAETILRSTALPIPPSPAGFTPLSYYAAWGTDATGKGLARGAAAVAEVIP